MCLGIPMKVIKINGKMGVVESMDVERSAAFHLLPDIKVGDWVILHAGYAIQLLDEYAAEETLRLSKEIYH
ncbi:MAG: HypC/HybG/HupF family hydrogenase formation chaperone [Spirochaetes bacterium]|nr:HypC/HybG/HupF family hydrogenase formation chaperone [Spirochaetota bacterium]